ncbi:MAG TPA: YihY family inner membrane protein [Campylobacterales bacterium]|nr:YihY family inner membrane protein [Campylobacterales bacterium]
MRHKIQTSISFIKNLFDAELIYYASSLSFYTIFSLVPIIILLFSIFTKLPAFESFYIDMQSFIYEHILPTHHEIIKKYIDSFISNSSKTELVGIVYMIVTSIMFFRNYEYIVNRIFQSQQRNFWNSLTLYWTMITLLPIVLISSIYLSIRFFHVLESSGYVSFSIFGKYIPYQFLLIWLLFFISYRISINVDIKNWKVVTASLFASIIWEIAKSGFVYYVIHNSTYASIYGSFSILMFFLLWINLSWIIFLLGLKLGYILYMNGREGQ